MQTPGSLLKSEREKKHLSIEAAASATKINLEYLIALEDDEFDKFPSSVYAKGFLQNYAKYLGANTDHILALYRRSVGEETKPEVQTSQKPLKQPKFVLTPTVVIVTIISIVILGALGYLVYQFYNFQKPPLLEIQSPELNSSTEEPEVTVEGTTEQGMFVTINDEPVKVSQTGAFSTIITLSRGSNTIIVKARHPDSIGKDAMITLTVEFSPGGDDETITADGEDVQESEDGETPDNISLLVTIGPENAWVEIEVDGDPLFSSVANPGDEYTYTAENEIYVRTGKVTSTTVTVNDEQRDLFVEAGGVASIRCTLEDGLVNCRQP